MASRLEQHPTVRAVRARRGTTPATAPKAGTDEILDAGWLRRICLEAGADDVGFVEIDRPALADQRADIDEAFPRPAALISFVRRTNREAIRSPARSIGNQEWHASLDDTNHIAHEICRTLEQHGVRAMNPTAAFPMEMDRWPGKIWVVSHKPVAVEAGLGKVGIHRNVIHPQFGNFILLETIVIGTPVSSYDSPIDFNPCLECKLCVAACPTGAISKTGEFDFVACTAHNYRDFLTGFGNWVESVAESDSAVDYRERNADSETLSMWQSLAYGPNYKAAYCVSVCPAGEDVIGPYLDDRKAHLDEVVRPLQDKAETVYVLADSDAEAHVAKRFPNKTTQQTTVGIRPKSIENFVSYMSILFQPGIAADLDAVYHVRFTGSEQRDITVTIRDRSLEVVEGHHGTPDLTLRADAEVWVRFLAGRASLFWALVRGTIRFRGDPRLLRRFGRCFAMS